MIVMLALLCALWGCAGGGGNSTVQSPPKIALNHLAAFYSANSSLNANFAIAGQGDFTLLTTGSGFTSSSLVSWNGAALSTTFGDSANLAAAVPASLIKTPGLATIAIKDSSSGSVSNALSFAIASPATANAGVVAMISAAGDGSPANGDSLVSPAISGTGRYVSFQSIATNLAPGPASGFQEIYERDTCAGAPVGCTPTTQRITVTYDGSPANGHSRFSAISGDGRFVAFDSQATNLLSGSSACAGATSSCVFLRDTCTGALTGCAPTTIAVSVNTQGTISSGFAPSLTPDGRFVAFQSAIPDLVAGGSSGGQVFVRDTCNGAPPGCTPATAMVSFGSVGAMGNSNSGLAAASAARFYAFQSWATNMLPNETIVPGNFLRDTCLGAPAGCTPSTTRVDVAGSGVQPNHGVFNGTTPAISSDGRLVAFASTATNLVSTNVNGIGNAYVRDTCSGATVGCAPTTTLVSLANDGSTANCASPSQGLSMNSNGRFVAFDSIATNLTPDDALPPCSSEDVFVRDTCYGVFSGCTPSTVRVSVAIMPLVATQSNALSGFPAISADGHFVVFLSAATNLLPGGSNGHQMVYLARTGF